MPRERRMRRCYPRNWPKVIRVIRRLAAGRCEWCHVQTDALTVHHIGTPYADGRPGDPHDKHDLRRENLVALCHHCHFQADLPLFIKWKRREKQRKRHAQLGVGTGLVLYSPPATAVAA